jgi:hypothetical protein
MKCHNQSAVIVGSVFNAGMKIVKIVIWGGPAGRLTSGRRMADVIWAVGFFFFFFGILRYFIRREGKDWLLHQHFHFLLLADVSSGYWWA